MIFRTIKLAVLSNVYRETQLAWATIIRQPGILFALPLPRGYSALIRLRYSLLAGNRLLKDTMNNKKEDRVGRMRHNLLRGWLSSRNQLPSFWDTERDTLMRSGVPRQLAAPNKKNLSFVVFFPSLFTIPPPFSPYFPRFLWQKCGINGCEIRY